MQFLAFTKIENSHWKTTFKIARGAKEHSEGGISEDFPEVAETLRKVCRPLNGIF